MPTANDLLTARLAAQKRTTDERNVLAMMLARIVAADAIGDAAMRASEIENAREVLAMMA